MEFTLSTNDFHFNWAASGQNIPNKKDYIITGNYGFCWKCIKELNPDNPELKVPEAWTYIDGEYVITPVKCPNAELCVQYGWSGSAKELCLKHFNDGPIASPGACNVHNRKSAIKDVPKSCKDCIFKMIENTQDLFKECKFPAKESTVCRCKYCIKYRI